MECNFLNHADLRNKVCIDDLILFDEIVACIDNECYRSASILIWISVLESLIRKLEVLGLNDVDVENFVKNFKDYGNEKDLLLKCKDHNLINQIEYAQLELIREARNNYAHPNFDSPLKEDVLVYLYYAVEYVLSKPTLFSLNSAKTELSRLLEDPNFLGNANENQVINHASSFSKKITTVHSEEIIKKLFKFIERTFNENNPNKQRCIDHGLIYGKILILDNLNLIDENICNYLIDNYKITSCHLFADDELWDAIDMRSKERIFNYSIDLDNNIFSEVDFINKFYKLYDKLDVESQNKFNDYINAVSVGLLFNTNLSVDNYFDRIINIFQTHDYYKIIPIANNILNININIFNPEQLEILGQNILREADNNSYASKDIIYKYEHETDVPKLFLKGLLFGVFVNENNELIFRRNMFQNILNILNKQDYAKQLFNELLIKVSDLSPLFMNASLFDKIIEEFDGFTFEDSQKEDLINAINQSKCKFINDNAKELLSIDSEGNLAQDLNDYFTDENKKIFLSLFDEDPLKFIRYFTKIKYKTFAVIDKIIINENLYNFVDMDSIKNKLNSLNQADFNKRVDKMIFKRFT